MLDFTDKIITKQGSKENALRHLSFCYKEDEVEEIFNRACHPQNYYDLRKTAMLLDYKSGWAYYEAKRNGFETPPPFRSYYSSSRKRTNYWADEQDDYDYAFSSYAEYDMMFD